MDFLCRTCMCPLTVNPAHATQISYHIFETIHLADKLLKCSSVGIDPSDKYSAWICKKCYEKVLDFWEFQEMCRESIKKFNEQLDKEAKSQHVDATDALACAVVSLVDNDQTAILWPPEENTTKNPLELSDNVANTKIEVNQTNRLRRRTRANETELSSHKEEKTREFNDIEEQENNKEDVSVKVISKRKVQGKLMLEDLNCADKQIEIELAKADEMSSLSDTNATSSLKTSDCQPLLKCNICPKQFNTQRRLEAHQRKHEGLPPYVCTHEGCQTSFDRWHYYQKHVELHTGGSNELYKCEINHCDRVYKNKSALNIHKRKHHNCGPELKTHMCEICGKVFKSSAVLNDHRFTHVEKSLLPYICEEEECAKRFSNKEKLKIHKMRHAGIKNFICPHCGMRKTTRNELKIHINYHTLERTWPCRFCAKVCNSAGNLKMHVRNIHERAKDFACRYCDRTFAKADTKKYHEMTHTGEKPHACTECGRRFLQPAALRTHRKIHLKDGGSVKRGAAATVKITNDLVEITSVENLNLFSVEHENVIELAKEKSDKSLLNK